MENQPINYREEITKALSFIPDAYLASLYHIIELIARPFRKQEKEDNRLDKETLQAYADTFRSGFSLLMKKNTGLNFYYDIQERFTIVRLELTAFTENQTQLTEESIDLEMLCEVNKVKIIHNEEKQKYELEYLSEDEDLQKDEYSEKMLLFEVENNSIYLIEMSDKTKWQADNASDDSRNLFALMLRTLSNQQMQEKYKEKYEERYSENLG